MRSLYERYVCENDHGERCEESRRRLQKVYRKQFKSSRTSRSPVTNISKSDLAELDNINKYISFVRQLLWYTTKVVPAVANVARELAVHMIHPGP